MIASAARIQVAMSPPCYCPDQTSIVSMAAGPVNCRGGSYILEHWFNRHTMDIITGNAGWIEVICGPMFSGKSEELIRRLRRAMIARKRVEVFKPVIDNRYSADEIVSHGDLRMNSQVVSNALEIMDRIDLRAEVIGVDEANFMGSELVDVAQRL